MKVISLTFFATLIIGTALPLYSAFPDKTKRIRLASKQAMLEKKSLIWKIWSTNDPYQQDVIAHLVRRAYYDQYPIPVELNDILKADMLDPDDSTVLAAAISLFELVDPQNPMSSDIRRRK